MTGAIMIEGMCPKISALKMGFGEYKYAMYHEAHGVDRILEVCTREWNNYQEEWKEQGYEFEHVPYPYTRTMIDGFFREWSQLMKIPISVNGPSG
mmetsp:Transcript_38601/g.52439  ORF Transcript_38601/g.52439 Transcript_38601/m.52439 type:complete len:95 (+) Transcript_38601:3-287(+)